MRNLHSKNIGTSQNRISFYASVLTLLFIPSSGLLAGNDQNIHIAGSNTIGAKLAPMCAKQFLRANGFKNVDITSISKDEYKVSGYEYQQNIKREINIYISAHGSTTGFIALANRTADIAMSSRAIKKEEADLLYDIGDMTSQSAEHAIALDGIAIQVNKNNPVNTLSIEQLAKIYSGEINNWSQIGGKNLKINLLARDENSGTWDTFKELVLAKTYTIHNSSKRFESSDELAAEIQKDESGIGFTGLSSIGNNKVLAISDSNGTLALYPTHFNIATEDYPLSRRLYLYKPYSTSISLGDSLVEFCLANEGQELVSDLGFVSQNIKAYQQSVTNGAPKEYFDLSQKAERLSVNFRFTNGSPVLDNKAYRDIERLSDFMNSEYNKDNKLVLVGFSDGLDQSSTNTVISRFRALAVKGALMEEGLDVTEILALGSNINLSSNKSEYGNTKNGRVEVWLVPKELNVKR